MKPYALTPYPMTPPDDPPEPDLSDAIPCVCGRHPDWDTNQFKEIRLFCYSHCVTAGYEATVKKAIEAWNYEVSEAGDREGENRKAAGQDKVAENNEEWMHYALTVIARHAATGNEFTVEDIRNSTLHLLSGRIPFPQPKSPNAWGAAFSAAAKQGLIVRTGYTKNKLASAHSRVVAVWKGTK